MSKTPIIASILFFSGMVWRWMCVRSKAKEIASSPLYIYILSLRYSAVFQLNNIVEEERTSIHTILDEVIGESENEAIWSNGRMTCWTSRTKPIRAITHIERSMVKSSIQECVELVDLIQRGFYTPLANQYLATLIKEQAVAPIVEPVTDSEVDSDAEPAAAPSTEPAAEPAAAPIPDEFLQIDRQEQILNRVLNEVDIEERQQRVATTWSVISYISRNALFYY